MTALIAQFYSVQCDNTMTINGTTTFNSNVNFNDNTLSNTGTIILNSDADIISQGGVNSFINLSGTIRLDCDNI